MCEQTEVHYLEGDVVWVKLGACWWPGRVRDVEKLPDDILESFRKKPIAAVQFFNEDKYEYVKNLDQICRYNCRRKNDFIKKGLDMHRAKQKEGSSFMDKFPKDVARAEQLTGGNPDIITDNTFAPDEKPSYHGLFGAEKKPEKKGKMSSGSPTKSSPSWRTKLASPSSPTSSISSPRRPITHPRIIRMLKGEEEQHDVRIRQQPTTPQRETSPQNEPYKCYKCDFTSKRLNVVILHSKSHSGDSATNGQELKQHNRSKSICVDSKSTPHRGRGRPRGSHSSSVGRPPKNSPKAQTANSTNSLESSFVKKSVADLNVKESSEEILSAHEKKSPKIPLFGKRKGSKTPGDKTTKKKRSTEDFKEKLLADWGDEDPEEEEKEMLILKQELSKSEGLTSPPHEGSSEDNSHTANKVTNSSKAKPKEISCFDFDENADSLLDHEFEERAKKFAEARKFPRRLDDRIDTERKSESLETNSDASVKHKVITSQPVKSKSSADENKNLQEEFETLMAETELPPLPAVPENKIVEEEKVDIASNEKNDDMNEDITESNLDSAVDKESEVSTQVSVEISAKDPVECPEPDILQCPPPDVPAESFVDTSIKSDTECLSEMEVQTCPDPSIENISETPVELVADTQVEETYPKLVDKVADSTSEQQHAVPECSKVISDTVPVSESPIDISPQPLHTALSQDSSQLSLAEEVPLVHQPDQTSLAQQPVQVSIAPDATHLSIAHDPSPIPIASDPVQIPLSQNSAQMSLEEMDLDINSMPVVMSDTLLSDDVAKFNMGTVLPTNSVAITLPPPTVVEKPVIQEIVRKNIISTPPTTAAVSRAVTLNVAPSSEFVTEASTSVVKSSAQTTSANSTPKILKQVVKSVKIQPGTSGTLKASEGSILTAKGTTGASRYVVIQHSSGKQTIYATSGGKPGQQCVTVKTGASQAQGSQQTVGKKLVIVKSPQGGSVSQEVLSSLQGLSSGGKIVPQRIITSQGAILKQVGRTAPKVMHVTPQQMKALTAGKQVGGTKLTMQSTPTKVVLPTVTKLVSQTPGVKVVASATTAKSKPNTILIQTTQGSNVGSTVVTRALSGTITVPTTAVQTKLTAIPQGVMRQVVGTTRQKLVASASSSGATVQRVVVSSAGRTGVQLQTQSQQKVIATRPGVQPRMLVQKGKGSTAVRVPNVGAIAGVQSQVAQIQQVKKVQSVLPRTQIIQKGKQSQVVQKVVTVQQQPAVSSVKATSSTEAIQTIALPSLQPLQPDVSIAPTMQQNFQSNTLVLSQAPTVINQNLTTQSASIATTSAPLMSHEHIAQVITPSGSEQLGESGTATYVLVTIDEQGTLQPYDSSNLMPTYDGNNQSTENSTRTLYIDPSSLGTSGDLENIFLAINNSSASGSGTLLNLGQTNTVSGVNISSAQHSQSVFNIADSQPTPSAGSQDILAAALANTDVFQSDGSMSDSLTVVNSSQSASGSVMTSRLLESSSLLPSSSSTSLHQTTVILPSLTPSTMPPANTAGVLETSLTLNQPIMTPLEVPSSVTNLQQPPPPIPTSLELPLTITQPNLSIPSSQFSELSQENSMPTEDSEVIESPISSSSMAPTTSQTLLTSRSTLQPSMPLLSEDVSDSQTPAVSVETPAHTEIMEPQTENIFDSDQTSLGGDSENCIVSGTSHHSDEVVLPTYAQVPEVSSHAIDEQGSTVNDVSYESNTENGQTLSDQGLSTSYQEVPESTSEASASTVQVIPEAIEIQSASEQTVSTSYARGLQQAVPKERAEIIDSSDPPSTENSVPKYSIENSSEAVAVKEASCVQEATVTDKSCVPYEQVESTSHLRETIGEIPTEVEHTLPSESNTLQSYTPAPESTSCVSGEVVENDTSGPFSLPSYSETPESTCELQEEKEVVPNQSTSTNYSQVPESTSHITEAGITGDSPMNVLDSSQHSLDSSVLTPYQVPESSSEASVVSYEDTHTVSDVNPPNSNQAGYASCSQVPESTSHMQEVLTFSDSSTEVSDCAVSLPQSMPLLLDTGPGAIGTKRPLEGDEHNANDLDHSKRVKIDETESLQFDGERIPIDDDDDDDLPSPCYPPSSLNQKVFARDDIVWMKVNKVYIPGVVIRADKKQRTAKVKCINSHRKEKAFSKRFNDLLDFNNHSRNQQLLEESRRINPTVQDAFDKITEYWCMNCVAEKPISAARYLTYHENDKQYGITLLCESEKEEEDNWNDTDSESGGDCQVLRTTEDKIAIDQGGMQDDDLFEQMQSESEQLIQIIESSEGEEHLRNVFMGLAPCKRHTLFMTKKNVIQKNLINESGLGPFDDETGIRMVSSLDALLTKIDETDIISTCGSRKDYLFHVFVPEAIIFAMCKVHGISYVDAEKRFKYQSIQKL